ncbi:hypothetical protein CaCOL14_013163 [Colletotrichum acutatum]
MAHADGISHYLKHSAELLPSASQLSIRIMQLETGKHEPMNSFGNSSNVVAADKSAGKPTDAVMETVSPPAAGTSSNIITADNRT